MSLLLLLYVALELTVMPWWVVLVVQARLCGSVDHGVKWMDVVVCTQPTVPRAGAYSTTMWTSKQTHY